MASIEKKGNCWRVCLFFRGKLYRYSLGRVTKTQALAIAKHFESLKTSVETGADLPVPVRRWLSRLGPRLKLRLIDTGLLVGSEAPSTLRAFCEHFEERNEAWADSTKKRWENLFSKLYTYFGEDKSLAAITEADAEDFAANLRSLHKSSHAGKLIADSRQLLLAAVRARVVHANPFHEGISTKQEIDVSRNAYVSEEAVDKLIASADVEFAAVIASARYGGVRIPSEVISMKWTDIDWDTKRIVIHDKKRKKDKVLPLFPKWEKALSRLWEQIPEGEHVYVFNRCRASANRFYRQWLIELIQRNKMEVWPKLWVTMRASRETDLKEMYPGAHHVVHDWIGNSQKVSEKHYDRIKPEHFDRALESQ